MQVELAFAPAYDVEVLYDFPGTGDARVLYIPPASGRGGRDGIPVRITPRGESPWIGIFAFGTPSGVGCRKIVSCPRSEEVCVVAAGAAYVVNVRDPSDCRTLTPLSVSDVRPVINHRVLLLADSTGLLAWGDQGLAWQCKRLAPDRIVIDNVDQDTVSGRGWDPSIPGHVHYRVRLVDGAVICDGMGAWPR